MPRGRLSSPVVALIRNRTLTHKQKGECAIPPVPEGIGFPRAISMIDISMQGAMLALDVPAIAKGGNVVLEFSSEGTPIEFPDLETCGYEMTMNGELVTWTKPTPITWSVTVIAGSNSDVALRNLLYAGHVGGRRGKPISQTYVHITSAELTVPSIMSNGVVSSNGKTTFSFANGRMTGGPTAIGSNAEGKMSPHTYKFVFESVKAQPTS